MNQKKVAVGLFAVSGVAAVIAAIAWSGQVHVATAHARWLGVGLMAAGAALAAAAALIAGPTFHGTIDPVTDSVITKGPYRILRHPAYLGITVALLGVSVVARSLTALVIVLAAFLPAAVYRARLEERALAARFPGHWREYSDRSSFMLPGIW